MSKDERYDVSQHEGHTEGKWYIDDGEGVINKEMENGDIIAIHLFEPHCDDDITEDEDTINKELLVSAPEILNALKKAYEEIDNLEWLLAKAHGEGNMVHSLVHLGVTQQVESLTAENGRMKDALRIINEDMKDCEEGGMPHVRKIADFVNDVCESEKIASE